MKFKKKLELSPTHFDWFLEEYRFSLHKPTALCCVINRVNRSMCSCANGEANEHMDLFTL